VAGQAAAVAQVVDLGAAAYAIRAVGAADPPVRLGRHASANETGSEKDSPRRLENWSSMTSEVEARSAGASWEKRDTLVVITFGDYAGRWLANRKVKGLLLAMRTREGYQDVLRRFILPTFGARPTHTISRVSGHVLMAHSAEQAAALARIRGLATVSVSVTEVAGVRPAALTGPSAPAAG
jgi:hypothetical protein